jgi:hypothetical protein
MLQGGLSNSGKWLEADGGHMQAKNGFWVASTKQ